MQDPKLLINIFKITKKQLDTTNSKPYLKPNFRDIEEKILLKLNNTNNLTDQSDFYNYFPLEVEKKDK